MTHCKEVKDYSFIFRFMAALAPLSRDRSIDRSDQMMPDVPSPLLPRNGTLV